jgi:hypothetical protein
MQQDRTGRVQGAGGAVVEFVTFHTAAWDDQWVLSLTLAEHQLFNYLISGPDFVVGHSFAERNPILWPIRTKLEMLQIDAILAKFEADGKVKQQNGIVWVVNGIHYQRLKGLNLTMSLQRIRSRFEDKAPDLVRLCWERYAPDTPCTPRVHPVYTGTPISDQIRSDQIRTKEREALPAADAAASPRKRNRFKPESVPLPDAISMLPSGTRIAWDTFAAMVARKRADGKVADSVLAALAQEVALRCVGMGAAKIAHGLLAASMAHGGTGADNANWVYKAARGFDDSAQRQEEAADQRKREQARLAAERDAEEWTAEKEAAAQEQRRKLAEQEARNVEAGRRARERLAQSKFLQGGVPVEPEQVIQEDSR